MLKRPGWYTVVACFVSSVITGVLALAVAIHVNTESERKWCEVVSTIDDSNRATPPASTSGKNFAAEISRLRKRLKCP